MMPPRAIVREILFPLTDTGVLFAIIGFAALHALASAAWLLGVWLYVVTLPAFFRYLLYLLEARANGRAAPVPGIELFNWVENFWSLFPLLLLALMTWVAYRIAISFSLQAAIVFVVALLTVMPASMAVLAVTRSPIQSLSPLAVSRIISACKFDYLLILLQGIGVGAVVYWLARTGIPEFLVGLLIIFEAVLLFTFTGAVMHTNDIVPQVDIPEPLEADEETRHEQLVDERKKIANHAYGFVSRGNRAGGLLHIRRWIDQEQDRDVATRWFFNEMLGWETTDAALFFAQEWIHELLGDARDVEALKLVQRCLLENPRFRPMPEDRARVMELARAARHDELLRQLR